MYNAKINFEREDMANQFLSLSLFLMLLSFFIVMNSVSSYEEKREQKVLRSVALAFSNNKVDDFNGAPDDTPNPLASINSGDTLTEIEGLFSATISGFEMSKNRLGTVMHVKLPIAKFENALDMSGGYSPDIGDGKRGSFVKTLVTLLRAEGRGAPFRIDMILNTEDDPAEMIVTNSDEFDKRLSRVSALGEGLENRGIPTKMLSVGLVKGTGGYIDLYFHKYKPFDFPELQKNKQEAAQ